MHNSNSLKDLIKKDIGISVNDCYQCGKCSAGCPLIEEMDISPNQVLRMIQMGNPRLDEKILRSYGIWLCLTCETCYTRCPMDVDLPKVMDYVRQKAVKENKVNPKAKKMLAFHKSFLQSVKMNGRLHEVSLVALYKMKTMNLMQDLTVAPRMFLKGKLSILPSRIKGVTSIKKLFNHEQKH